MRIAIMQPYFLPYIGYWQLMGAVDVFVIYDRIKHTKKGWINRNRMLINGMPVTFSLPLAADADSKMITERRLATSFERRKLLAQIDGAYKKAPQFESLRPWLENVVLHPSDKLFDYLWNSIDITRNLLALPTRLIASSSVPHDETLKAQDRVLALCTALGANQYVNAIGGVGLYEPAAFDAVGIKLSFHKTGPMSYPQFGAPFVPFLSILDVLMFNSIEETKKILRSHFTLVQGDTNIHPQVTLD